MGPFESVLDAARAGGAWAWRRLYDDYSPRLFGYLRSQGAAEPEDLLGEVWLRVAKSIHDFEGGEAGFRSWLFVIAHHRLMDDWRKRKRRPVVPMSELPETTAVHLPESENELAEMLESLTPSQKTVLVLRFGADLAVADVARAMGKTEGAVKLIQHRALARLRKKHQMPVTESDDKTVT